MHLLLVAAMNRNFSLATVIAISAIALTVLFSAGATAKSPCLLARDVVRIDWSKIPQVAGITLAAT